MSKKLQEHLSHRDFSNSGSRSSRRKSNKATDRKEAKSMSPLQPKRRWYIEKAERTNQQKHNFNQTQEKLSPPKYSVPMSTEMIKQRAYEIKQDLYSSPPKQTIDNEKSPSKRNFQDDQPIWEDFKEIKPKKQVKIEEDFGKKYDKLVSKLVKQGQEGRANFHTEVLLPQSNIQEYLDKQSSSSRNKVDPNIHERLYKERSEKDQKLKHIYQPNLKEDIEVEKYCTFKPTLTGSQKPRTFNEFYRDQEDKEQKRKLNLQQKTQKVLQAEVPKFEYKSKEYFTKKESREQTPIQKKTCKTMYRDYSFKPTINKKSVKIMQGKEGWNAQSHLLEDIKKRKASAHDTSQAVQYRTTVSAAEQSKRILLKKFQKEFEDACEEVVGDRRTLNAEEYVGVMSSLGFLLKQSKRVHEQLDLAWKILARNGETLRKSDLFILLSYMQQLEVEHRSGQSSSEDEEQEIDLRDIGEFKGKRYQVTTELDKRRAYIAFLTLVQNRREFQCESVRKRKMSRSSSDSDYGRSFNMSRKSKEIIDKKQEKVSNKQYISNLHKKHGEFQEKVESIRKKQQDQQMGQCTFKPQLKKNQYNSKDRIRYSSTEKLSQPRSRLRDKTPIEIDFEVNGKECTFKPSLVHPQYTITGTKGGMKGKIRFKPLNRKAIESRDQINLNSSSGSLSRSSEEEPLLCLDVKLTNEKTEQLIVGQEEDLEEAVQQFAIRNQLTQYKTDKLLQIMKEHLKAAVQAKKAQ